MPEFVHAAVGGSQLPCQLWAVITKGEAMLGSPDPSWFRQLQTTSSLGQSCPLFCPGALKGVFLCYRWMPPGNGIVEEPELGKCLL